MTEPILPVNIKVGDVVVRLDSKRLKSLRLEIDRFFSESFPILLANAHAGMQAPTLSV